MTKSLKQWSTEAHALALEKGFYENCPDPKDSVWISARLALIHAELSEALECVRKGEMDLLLCPPLVGPFRGIGDCKPEGFGIELADVFLRLADLAESLDLNLDELVSLKHEYNKSRPHKHGKKI